MNKIGKTTVILSSVLILVILISSIYIFMPESVKLVVGNTNSKFYVWEDEKWTLSATEYVNIFDGTTKMRAKSREVNYQTDNNITTITRTSLWKNNITTIDTYTFNSAITNVELFPISHTVNILNAKDKILHFEYRDLLYDGVTRTAISPESFGHNMKVEWIETDDFMWAKVYQQKVASDKLIVRYRVGSNGEVFTVRLFDPSIPVTQTSVIKTNVSSLCYQDIVNNNNQLEGWCNVTDTDDDNIGYEYKWFKNSILFVNGSTINYAQGINTNLNNISIINITLGDEWVFGCRGTDGYNYSNWTNSTTVTIHNISFSIDGTSVITLTSPISKELGSVILNATINAYDRNVSSVSSWGGLLSCDADNDKIFSAELGIRYLFNFSVATDGTATYDGTFLTFSGDECPSNAIDYYYDVINSNHYFLCANRDIYIYNASGNYTIHYNPTKNYGSITGNGTHLFLSDASTHEAFITNLSAENEVALTGTSELCDYLTYNENDDTIWCKDFTNDRLSHFQTDGTRINFEAANIIGESIAVCGDMNYLYSNDQTDISWYDISNNYVCIDDSHIDFGNNYSCGMVSTQFDAKVSSFHTRTLSNGSSSTKLFYNGPQNRTFNIIVHQHDEFNNLTFNMTGHYYNGSYPHNVNIYINDTKSNSIGILYNTSIQTITEFNDSSTIKRVNWSTSEAKLIGYIKVPIKAIVVNSTINVSGSNNYSNDLNLPNYPFVVFNASNMDVSAFNGTNNCNMTIFVNPLTNETLYILYTEISNTTEVKRAVLYETLFYGTNTMGNNPLATPSYLGNLSHLWTTVTRDVNKRVYYAYVFLRNDNINHWIGVNYTAIISDIVTNKNFSSWTNMKNFDGGISASAVSYVIINETETLFSKESAPTGWGELYTVGSDTTNKERDNPINVTLKAITRSTSGSGYAEFGVLMLSSGNLIWTIDTYIEGGAMYTLTYKNTDFYNTYSIPELSLWSNFSVQDPWIEVGGLDGNLEWNYTGGFTGTNSFNITTAINDYLDICIAGEDGFCNVPIYAYSDTFGELSIDDLNVQFVFDTNPVIVNVASIQNYLDSSTNSTILTIIVENSQNGSITISDIDYDYLGGVGTADTIRAHSADGFCNISNILKYAYSGWNYNYPPNIDYIDWYPWSPTAKNVTPFGQTDNNPIVNVTTYNYETNLDFAIKMYGSTDCVTLTVDTDNSKSGGTMMVNNTYITLASNQSYNSNLQIWLWADLTCSYTDWRLWSPVIEFKATVVI